MWPAVVYVVSVVVGDEEAGKAAAASTVGGDAAVEGDPAAATLMDLGSNRGLPNEWPMKVAVRAVTSRPMMLERTTEERM